MRASPLTHGETVAATLRGLKILSPFNEKTPKGESEGYLTAVLYLAPHTLAGGRSVCPHSTPACREGCLYWAGRGKTPRVQNARITRTRLYQEDRERFLYELVAELRQMDRAARSAGMKLAIRLNGTSDILWEREMLDFGRGEQSLFDLFPEATFYDYTRTPLHHRKVPENWRLVFSLADLPVAHAADHLAAGVSVAAVVSETDKAFAPEWIAVGDHDVEVVDGDKHDLRFLDPAPALVLLKPKGRLRSGERVGMVRRGLIPAILKAAKAARENGNGGGNQ